MPRITKKGQVTIPKEIREKLGVRPNDIGEFVIKEGSVIFTVKKGTLLDAHRKSTRKKSDMHMIRDLMEKENALNIIREME